MSSYRTVEIECDDCGDIAPTSADGWPSARVARAALAALGWTYSTYRQRSDYCPACTNKRKRMS